MAPCSAHQGGRRLKKVGQPASPSPCPRLRPAVGSMPWPARLAPIGLTWACCSPCLGSSRVPRLSPPFGKARPHDSSGKSAWKDSLSLPAINQTGLRLGTGWRPAPSANNSNVGKKEVCRGPSPGCETGLTFKPLVRYLNAHAYSFPSCFSMRMALLRRCRRCQCLVVPRGAHSC